jgi:hypothetical protein
MSGYREAVEQALAATTILSPTSFAWFGVPQQSLPARSEAAMDGAAARAYLVYALQARLYGSFYCLGAASRDGFEATPPTRLGPSPFLLELSRANRGRGSHEAGWTVAALQDDRVVVERDGLRLWVRPEDLHDGPGRHASQQPGADQPGAGQPGADRSGAVPSGLVRPDSIQFAALQPGAAVGVLMPKELMRLSPGFYMALGDAEFPADASVGLVRFYWCLRQEGAALLVETLTGTLNEAGLSFRLKVISDPAAYRRCDAGVLYALAPQYERVARIVADVYREVEPWLGGSIPALTKPLAPGLGLAEDPGAGGESFGMSRCRLLAEGIVTAAELRAGSLAQTLEVVAGHFAQAGISLEQPYLSPGSVDRYHLPEVSLDA